MLKKIFILLALLASAYSAFIVVPFAKWYSQEQGAKVAKEAYNQPQKLPVEAVVLKTTDGPKIIQAQIADEPEEQSKGLMFRKTMYDDEGMLFIYEQVQDITMWMQNTILPLDMVFISKQGKITHIAYGAQPHSLDIISSQGPAKAVLEINAGMADKLKLAVGDMVNHAAFEAEVCGGKKEC